MSNTPIRRVVTREKRLTAAQWREILLAVDARTEELSTNGGPGDERKLAALNRAWTKLYMMREDLVL